MYDAMYIISVNVYYIAYYIVMVTSIRFVIQMYYNSAFVIFMCYNSALILSNYAEWVFSICCFDVFTLLLFEFLLIGGEEGAVFAARINQVGLYYIAICGQDFNTKLRKLSFK